MRPFLALLRRDLKLAMRDGGALGTALGFYLLVVAILPLGLGPDLNLLSRIAPGILWVALLLAALLSLPRMFEIDDEDGSLEVLATGDTPLELIAAAKSLAHWLATALPLSLMAPGLGLLLNLDLAAYPALLATLIGGTPAISFIGAICAALTLRSRPFGRCAGGISGLLTMSANVVVSHSCCSGSADADATRDTPESRRRCSTASHQGLNRSGLL